MNEADGQYQGGGGGKKRRGLGTRNETSGQAELNATLKTIEESLSSLNEAMSMGDLNVSFGNTDEMSESEISQEVEHLSDKIDQLLAETPQNEGNPHKTTEQDDDLLAGIAGEIPKDIYINTQEQP